MQTTFDFVAPLHHQTHLAPPAVTPLVLALMDVQNTLSNAMCDPAVDLQMRQQMLALHRGANDILNQI